MQSVERRVDMEQLPMKLNILLTIAAIYMALVLGNIVGFAAIAALDLWGSFAAGRPPHKVFAVIHLLFAVAFIWAGRRSMSTKEA